MADRIDIIITEITVDPLLRVYSGMTNLQVADDMNLINRPDDVDIADVLKFLMLDNTYKEDDGNDTQDRSIWQRMKEVAAIAIPGTGAVANPWGAVALGTITEIRLIKTQQLVDYFTLTAQGSLTFDISNSNFQVYLAGSQTAGCMSSAQKDALLALADNRQSRGQELGIGIVREGHVQEARL